MQKEVITTIDTGSTIIETIKNDDGSKTVINPNSTITETIKK